MRKEQYRKKNNGNRLTKFQHMAASSQAGNYITIFIKRIKLEINILNIDKI